MIKFRRTTVFGYKALFNKLDKIPDRWLFRGQWSGHRLKTRLERECENSNINGRDRQRVEWEMIREFKRWYDGSDKQDVRDNTLYCMSLMQHHGAPTRLLDWTYSRYVAAYFALESASNHEPNKSGDYDGKRSCSVWCLNGEWAGKCGEEESILSKRFHGSDEARLDDNDYRKLFVVGEPGKIDGAKKFIIVENPIRFHSRMYVQQAIFTIPGDVTEPFEENLKFMPSYDKKTSLYQIICHMDREDLEAGLQELWRMNISNATLFPGLDGFAKSMTYRLPFFLKVYDWRHQ